MTRFLRAATLPVAALFLFAGAAPSGGRPRLHRRAGRGRHRESGIPGGRGRPGRPHRRGGRPRAGPDRPRPSPDRRHRPRRRAGLHRPPRPVRVQRPRRPARGLQDHAGDHVRGDGRGRVHRAPRRDAAQEQRRHVPPLRPQAGLVVAPHVLHEVPADAAHDQPRHVRRARRAPADGRRRRRTGAPARPSSRE